MTAALRSRTELENAVIAWVQSVQPSGRVIVGWPGATRPTLPYVTIRFTGIAPIGQDDRGAVDLGTGLQTIYGDRLLTVSVQAFGTGALDLIRALSNSIWKETTAAALLAAGLCPQQPGPINDLTKFLETDAEERAHIDMNFGIKDLDTDNVGVIERVTGDGTIRTESGDAILISFDTDLA